MSISLINQSPVPSSLSDEQNNTNAAQGAGVPVTWTNTSVYPPHASGLSTVAGDQFVGASGARGTPGGILASLPPAFNSTQPTNYQANLQSASSKLGALPQTGSSNANAMALAVIQNGGTIKPSPELQEGNSAETKMGAINAQADSLQQSAEVSHKTGCHRVYDNHDTMVNKLKQVGMSDRQAKTTVRMLEDGRTPPDAKAKISFQLASLGVTAAGSANTSALAANSTAVLSSMQSFADKEDSKLRAVGGVSAAATGVAALSPVVGLIKAAVTHDAVGKVMQGASTDANSLAMAYTVDDATLASGQAAVDTVGEQTLRPALSQAQRAL